MISKRLPRRILVILTSLTWSASAIAFAESIGTGWWLLGATTLFILILCVVLVRAFGGYALGFGWKLDERQRATQERTYAYGGILTATGFGLLVGARAGEEAVTTLSQFAALNFSSGAIVALALLFFSSNVLASAWLEPDPPAETEEAPSRISKRAA